MSFRNFIFAASFAAFVAACASDHAPTPSAAPSTAIEKFRATEFRRDQARFKEQTPEDFVYDVKKYALRGAFDWSQKKLNASIQITLKLKSPAASALVLDNHTEVTQVRFFSEAGPGVALPFQNENGSLKIGLNPLSAAIKSNDFRIQIDYSAASNLLSSGLSSAITAVPARLGDPAASRVVYTTSEPRGASDWMPCHNVPSDRALFSAEFTFPKEESLIANGDLVLNSVEGAVRRMKYQTRYPLPTYLMAFAVGEFATTTLYHHELPVSVWARRGIPVDAEGMAKHLIDSITHYESLLVPYPFEKYAIVLLPEFPAGGVEHAGITFQGETYSTESALDSDRGLAAHELGHQWFGDYVTLEKWDDLWIKEGMATLLSEESSRRFEDQNQSGRLFGMQFAVSAGDAIFDPSLAPEAKYTSGPYGRSAWLLTQIRSLVGEAAFWSTLRGILQNHAYGNIGTESFLEAFRPSLGDEKLAQAKKALVAKAMPQFEVTASGSNATFSLKDPEASLLAPIELRWYQSQSHYETQSLVADKPLTANYPNSLLVIDPKDVHALPYFETKGLESVLPQLIPATPEARSVFSSFASASTRFALSQAKAWDITADQIGWLVRMHPSETLKYRALQTACEIADRKNKATPSPEWSTALAREFLSPLVHGMPRRASGKALSACANVLPADFFKTAFSQLAASPASPFWSELQVIFLALQDQEPADALSTWGAVSLYGPSIRLRALALEVLRNHLSGGFKKPAEKDVPAYRVLIHEVLSRSEASEVLETAIAMEETLKDETSLPRMAEIAAHSLRDSTQREAFCAGYRMTKAATDQWKAFVAKLGPESQWNTWLKGAVTKPGESCAD